MKKRMLTCALALCLILPLLTLWASAWNPFGGEAELVLPDVERAFNLAVARNIESDSLTLSGEARYGQTLSLAAEGDRVAAAFGAGSAAYLWQRCDGAAYAGDASPWEEIPGAEAADYVLTEADIGCYIRGCVYTTGDFGGSLTADTLQAVLKLDYTGEAPVESTCASPTDITITVSIDPDQEYAVVPYGGESQPAAEVWEDSFLSDGYDWHRFKGLIAGTDYAVWTRIPGTETTYPSAAVPSFFRTEQLDSPYVDVEADDWYAAAVIYASGSGLMTGDTENEFNPHGLAQRSVVVTALWRLAGEPESKYQRFKDVKKSDWCADAVSWAVENEIVTGYDDNTFKPTASVTREQLAAFLGRFARYMGHDTTATADLSVFADSGDIQAFALEDVRWCVELDMLGGVTEDTLAPAGNATRAQFASMLMRFSEIY